MAKRATTVEQDGEYAGEELATDTHPDLTINRRCDNCGQPLVWTLAQLEEHLRRTERGEHAACACDDECASESPTWSRRRLRRAIGAIQDRLS